MWTAKHVNSQVVCLLSAYPEPTSPPPRARTEQLSTLVSLFLFATGHLAWMKWFRSQHTFGYLLCDFFFFLLPLHIIHWYDCSTLISLFTLTCTCFYMVTRPMFSLKHHFEHLGMAPPLATRDLALFEQMHTGRGWSLAPQVKYLHQMSPLCPWQR